MRSRAGIHASGGTSSCDALGAHAFPRLYEVSESFKICGGKLSPAIHDDGRPARTPPQ